MHLVGSASQALPATVRRGLVCDGSAVAVLGQNADVHGLVCALADLVVVERRSLETQATLVFLEGEAAVAELVALAAQVVRHSKRFAICARRVAPSLGPVSRPIRARREIALHLAQDTVQVLVAAATVSFRELGPVEAARQELSVAAAVLLLGRTLPAVAIPVHLARHTPKAGAAALFCRPLDDGSLVSILGQDADVHRLV
mmetsp:Transcript_16106/g.38569  ORF Transcript_16106/g.38569 Transcript_16106/m.38569 type:complete len:201 (+) Transcript_16106:91-693(+)